MRSSAEGTDGPRAKYRGPVRKIRRSNARKVAKLARALVALEQARVAPTARKRVTKLSLS